MTMVNQLPLPSLLVELIASKRWSVSGQSDLERWTQFFQHGGLAVEGDMRIRLFSIDEMAEATARLSQADFPVKVDPAWKGSIVNRFEPLSVIPERSIVIADLLHCNRFPEKLIVPIVLDYQCSVEIPRVICYPDDAFEQYWYEVSPSFKAFAAGLGL